MWPYQFISAVIKLWRCKVDNNEDITETKILGELSSCFDDLKSFVGNLEIPSDFAEFFSNSYDKTEVDSAPPSSSTNQTDKRDRQTNRKKNKKKEKKKGQKCSYKVHI